MCKGFSCWDPLGSEILEPFWGEFERVAMLDSLRNVRDLWVIGHSHCGLLNGVHRCLE